MNKMTSIRWCVCGALLAALAVLGTSGCASHSWKPSKMFSLKSTWPFHDENELVEGTPTRLAGTWTDTVMTQPGKKPIRGFGGRIMFYETDEKKPILVDGQLVVYAFDETGREPTDTKPTRRYVFPAEQMPLHMSKNEFGASYSFFLPWDEAGGPRTEVSLICRFEPKGGSMISGEQARLKLPGVAPTAVVEGSPRPPKVPDGVPVKPTLPTLQSLQTQRTQERNAQLASYEAAVPGTLTSTGSGEPGNQAMNTATVRKMTSTTIDLPSTYQMPSAAAVANQEMMTTRPAKQSATSIVLPTQQTLPMQQEGMSGLAATAAGPTNLLQPQPQQAAQQLLLQQQLMQQQLLQQQALQQRLMPAASPATMQLPAQQLPQMTLPTGGTATLTHPASGVYRR